MPSNKTIANTFKRTDSIEFLPAALEVLETPPAPFGRIIAATISILFLCMVVWSYFGSVDIVVVADGQTFPVGKVKTIQPLETGVVRAINVHDGQRVKEDELLVQLDPTEVEADLESLEIQLVQARVEAALGKAMLSPSPVDAFALPSGTPEEIQENSQSLLKDTIGKLNASLAAIEADISRQQSILRSTDIEQRHLEAILPVSQERLEGLVELFGKGLAEKAQLLDLQREVFEMNASLETLIEKRTQARAAISSLQAQHSEAIATYRTQAADRRQTALSEITATEQSLRKAKQRQIYRQLRAPVSGYVDKLAIHTIGAVVETGTQLMTIVPSDTALEIEATILNKDIGFVQVGQLAEIKLEAFPFTRYGVLHGSVISLSNDVSIDEALGPIYKAKIMLDRQSISIENKDFVLSPGMRATVEVKTGKRKIVDFFLSPILRYKDEAIKER